MVTAPNDIAEGPGVKPGLTIKENNLTKKKLFKCLRRKLVLNHFINLPFCLPTKNICNAGERACLSKDLY
jgi:hypothetical protein